MASQTLESAALRPGNIVIAVMGVTGAGKSTFIEKVTGQNVGVGHGLISHTAAVSIYAYRLSSDRCVYLVDTPGFDDTSHSDTEILKEVAFFLSQIYRNDVKLAGIIYLHRITDNRVSGTALKNLNMFKQLCGDEAFGHVILATSMWDTLDATLSETGVSREKELTTRTEFWGTMHKSGSQVVRWLGNEESAQGIIAKIIEVHDRSGKAMLKIQDELVNKNLTLDETAAGQEVQREILVAKARLQEEIKQLRSEHEKMMRQSNETLAEELASQQQVFEMQLDEANEARETLKISLQSFMEEKTAEYERLLTGAVDEQRQLTEALAKKEAEFERARRERAEDEETFREAQAHFKTEAEVLKLKIEDQECATEQKKKLEEELRSVKELQEELKKQQREDEEAAATRKQEIGAEMERKSEKRQKTKDVLGLLGVLAGVGTAAAGMMTMNPALMSLGGLMASSSTSAFSR
ncbi:P-loop containing nucleoside triphosphate hydrolase protein [Ilyonectria destructans]|nr:P-loop containing nucleoside triphosphate hydrolase protein [Ilyonectria destructans]